MARKKLKQLRIKFLDIPKEILVPRNTEKTKIRAIDKKYKNLRVAKLTKTLIINEKQTINTQEQKIHDTNVDEFRYHNFQFKTDAEKQFSFEQNPPKIDKNNDDEEDSYFQQINDIDNNDSILPDFWNTYINYF